MVTDTDGIILRQIRLPGDRRMLVILTRRFGKISAGTSIKLNGKNKSSLAIRAFTHGRYEIFHGRESYNINAAETMESYYKIGEDVDKYLMASYALEFTEKVLQENYPAEEVLDLLLDFLKLLEARKSRLQSLLVMYQWKLIGICGYMPQLHSCVKCGRPASEEEKWSISIPEGGIVCSSCAAAERTNPQLIYSIGFDIIKILDFIRRSDLKSLGRLALKDGICSVLSDFLREYAAYHLEIRGLKSESYISF